jgi:hypothetical protein
MSIQNCSRKKIAVTAIAAAAVVIAAFASGCNTSEPETVFVPVDVTPKFSITGVVLDSDEDGGGQHGSLEFTPKESAPATTKITISAIPDIYFEEVDNELGGGGR